MPAFPDPSLKIRHTAEAISDGGRTGVVHSPDQTLRVTLVASTPGATAQPGPNPELLFAGAYAACFHGALASAARKLDAQVGDFAVRALVGLTEDETGGHRLAVELHVQLTGVDRARAQHLLDEAHKTCPYSRALRGDATVTLVAD